ncbi:MAG: hypothetical protein KF774_16895 [Planctomyces sp.]|nr:hypothetical protein [Planctomyces sp.]
MLPVGIIGAGPEWETTWRPALLAQSRLKVAAFHDPIAARGEAAALDVDAPLLAGARDLLDVPGLRGLLVLDAGWLGAWVVREAARRGLATLIASGAIPFRQLADVDDASPGDVVVQPDLRRRYTPATMRLRELTATTLGPIQFLSAEMQAAPSETLARLSALVDWCRFVVQSAVVRAEPGAEVASLRLTFRKEEDGHPVRAEVRIAPTAETSVAPDFSAEVACRSGAVSIRDNRCLAWRTADSSEDEQLSDDRSSAHVQLDLFGRRLVGGLVPAPGLEDLQSAARLVRDALEQASPPPSI